MISHWDKLCLLRLKGWGSNDTSWTFAESSNLSALTAIIEQQALPLECIGRFLHELTHHLIFNTKVCRALADLERHTHKVALNREGILTPRVQAQRMGESFFRFWVTVEFLNPLIEGIALYAEHDLYDRGDEMVSDLLPAAWCAFCRGRRPEPGDWTGRAINRALLSWRTEGEGYQRKLNLLQQPLDVAPDDVVDGGLAAYLFLKSAAVVAAGKHPSFDNVDFFIAYTMWFFFEDDAFTKLLRAPLTTSIKAGHSYSKELVTYLKMRCDSFVRSFNAENVAEFQKFNRGRHEKERALDQEIVSIARHPVFVSTENRNAVITAPPELAMKLEYLPGRSGTKGEPIIEYFIHEGGQYFGHALRMDEIIVAVKHHVPRGLPSNGMKCFEPRDSRELEDD